MVQGFEKRTCHRFEVPGSSLMYKKIGWLFNRPYLPAVRLYNISKGGVAFACDEELKIGKEIITKISIPDEKDLELLATVLWQRDSSDGIYLAIGVSFTVFGGGPNQNSTEALNTLRRLDQQYVTNR
jgi:Tfp pilus assembly protein PilZ